MLKRKALILSLSAALVAGVPMPAHAGFFDSIGGFVESILSIFGWRERSSSSGIGGALGPDGSGPSGNVGLGSCG